MRRYEPGDPETVLTRVMERLDRVAHHAVAALEGLDRVRADVDAHTRTLADLTALVRRSATNPANRAGEPPAGDEVAVEWLTVTDPALAVTWLAKLHVWVTRVWTYYQPLPACWAWHPAVVAELLTCQQVWLTATTTEATPDALAAWHDRWRPGTARRVTHALLACERTGGSHVVDTGTRWAIDPRVTDELAVWWATTHATTTTPAPGLTREDTR